MNHIIVEFINTWVVISLGVFGGLVAIFGIYADICDRIKRK